MNKVKSEINPTLKDTDLKILKFNLSNAIELENYTLAEQIKQEINKL